MLSAIAVTAIGLTLFHGLRPAGELCAVLIRKRWPEAWFSSFIVWDADFLALTISVIASVVVVLHVTKRYLNSNLYTTQKLLGHSNLSATADVHTHVSANVEARRLPLDAPRNS